MRLALAFCYFVFGFALSFPAIATQFIFIDSLHVSPVGMAFAYSLVSVPWCLKPLWGFISDKYTVLNWGKRRPYIAYSGLLASYVYLSVGKVLSDFYAFLLSLIFISFLLCMADVCADSITVEIVKKQSEEEEGILQGNNWIGRALGTLSGSFLGGMAFNSLGAPTVYKLTAIMPFLMACIIWQLPASDHAYEDVTGKLWANLKKQKELAIILLLMTIAPNYGTFYMYFLTDKLRYTPIQFTWLNMSSSLSFLLGVVAFRVYFRKFKIQRVLVIATLISVLFRLPQLLVVTGVYQEFWLIAADGVIESFSYQLVILPLIVYTAKRCDAGCEGSLFALMMSISNFSGILGDQLGALVAGMLGVTEENFDNLKYLMVIAIVGDLVVPLLAIRRMFYASSPDYSQLDRTPELRMIRTPGSSESRRGFPESRRGSSESRPGSPGRTPGSAGRPPSGRRPTKRPSTSPELSDSGSESRTGGTLVEVGLLRRLDSSDSEIEVDIGLEMVV